MTKTDTRDSTTTLRQIAELAQARCEFVRLALPDEEAAASFGKIAKKSPLPLVADIHFDYRLALKAIENGAAKIRFNPGNIGKKEDLLTLVAACKKAHVPIRIGVNAGSLEKKYAVVTAENLAESALEHAKVLEGADFFDICLSIKASDPTLTIAANRLLAIKTDYPLHIGLTEAGTEEAGTIKSAVALGALLAEGIGDTLRVSLTGDPVREVEIAHEILAALKLGTGKCNFISCPGCGRSETDHREIAHAVYKATQNLPANLTIAVMGCIVNGPGEAAHADFALVGGKKHYAIYAHGKLLKTVAQNDAVREFLEIIE